MEVLVLEGLEMICIGFVPNNVDKFGIVDSKHNLVTLGKVMVILSPAKNNKVCGMLNL